MSSTIHFYDGFSSEFLTLGTSALRAEAWRIKTVLQSQDASVTKGWHSATAVNASLSRHRRQTAISRAASRAATTPSSVGTTQTSTLLLGE